MKTIPFILATVFAAASAALAATPGESNYIAHEWGTFTSVQGSDGIQLEWNPFTVSELPQFVYNVQNPQGRAKKLVLPSNVFPGKTAFLSRQRMETPVIYFYSDQPRTVNVDVTFPEGQLTEWYPQLAPIAKPTDPQQLLSFYSRSALRWGNVDILPGNGAAEAEKFAKDDSKSHYYPARETDAAALRVKTADGTDQYEKFLFYRGVGQFEAPLKTSHWGDNAEQIRIHNTSAEPLGPFFIYGVRGDRAALVQVPALGAQVMDDKDFKFDKIARPKAEVQAELREKLRATLTSAGLYEKEAAAMVKTWDDAWLGEQGTRVLYLLPEKWSNATLPLKISPAPKELKRVFVGRAEIITPAQEWAFLREVVRYSEGGTLEKKAAVAAIDQIGLGRFADAAARHASQRGPSAVAFNQAVFGLLDDVRKASLKTTNARTALVRPNGVPVPTVAPATTETTVAR